MNIFVVIPAYNEEERIRQVLDDLSLLPYKIVVVDDASVDKTSEIVATYPNVVLLRHRLNRDQGAALQTGNQYALARGADLIVHFDADGQFLSKEIEEVIQPILEGNYDIVFGSRFLEKKSDIPAFKKKIIFPLAKLVNRVFLGIKTSDPQSGFRAMTREVAERIQIEQDGKAHCSEIMAKAFEYKLKIKEVPITVIYHEFGQSMGHGFKILKDILFSKISK
ncbi:MAG: glycosyltransferase family 2 protein [Candidatus Komeilibacteria bacterium]|mgnify:CR=1 FL=1|jgi:polyprenyl-phospho-N-acetylgalactosaminyl synthase|nr:glycosyltransferase family 2 protein [Candidatus Komeilibacteria bacterium]MBT4448066.1 glycosyltransferase family 2 protein [Candidatus Komeilibacteria bacterium]